jgi:hypothetical protein
MWRDFCGFSRKESRGDESAGSRNAEMRKRGRGITESGRGHYISAKRRAFSSF